MRWAQASSRRLVVVVVEGVVLMPSSGMVEGEVGGWTEGPVVEEMSRDV